jgi:hypothetical protein
LICVALSSVSTATPSVCFLECSNGMELLYGLCKAVVVEFVVVVVVVVHGAIATPALLFVSTLR